MPHFASTNCSSSVVPLPGKEILPLPLGKPGTSNVLALGSEKSEKALGKLLLWISAIFWRAALIARLSSALAPPTDNEVVSARVAPSTPTARTTRAMLHSSSVKPRPHRFLIRDMIFSNVSHPDSYV